MTLPISSHSVPPEDYAYLSGFLKARETRFFKKEDFIAISRLMNLSEFLDYMNKHGYKILSSVEDPAIFEDYLWIPFKNEIASVEKLAPEEYLITFVTLFRKILFWKRDDLLLSDFKLLSKNGTSLTLLLSKLVIDRFNFFEKIRSILNKTIDWSFEEGGNLDQTLINAIFDTYLKSIDISKQYYTWKPFFEKECNLKQYDFDFMNRLDSFWKSIIETSLITAYWQTYGLDYCISYFVKWFLEIESLTKVFFTLRFGLHFDLREELYLHVR